MKVLMISDIHGISKNMDILESKVDLNEITYIVLLGDLFRSVYTTDEDRKKIIKFMNNYKSKLIVVKGNTDSYEDILDIPVNTLDIELLKIDDIDFYFTHGDKYNCYSDNIYKKGVLVYGHEHIPYIKKDNKMIYINVGSISLPRSDDGKTFAIYDNGKIKIYNLDNMEEIYGCSI